MTSIITIKIQQWKKQKHRWHKINQNLSDSAQLLFDSPAGYKLYISVSNAKSKRLCIHQQATEQAISLIVLRHECLGSWPWYSWRHCFPLTNADENSKDTLKSSVIIQVIVFYMMCNFDDTESENTAESSERKVTFPMCLINVSCHKQTNLRLCDQWILTRMLNI